MNDIWLSILGAGMGLAVLFIVTLFRGGNPSNDCTGDCRQGRDCTCRED